MEIRAFISEHPKFGRMRSLLIDGEPFFAGKDAATALGYKDTDQALRMHVPDKSKRVLTAKDFKQVASNQEPVILTGSQMASNQANRETGTFFSDNAMGGVQRLTFISEAGLYKLILRSKLPAAEEFSDWVCEEVLTSIRKHGYYSLVSETKPVAEKPKKNQKRVDAQSSPAHAYVFLLVASSFFVVKIGISKDLKTRKKTVERETNATVCHIYQTALLPRKIARLLEKLCKEYFSSSGLSGEYFFADYNEVCKVLNMLEKMVEALPSVNDHVRAEELLQIADTMGNTPERKNILIEAANIIAGKKVA